ncbi:ATP-dependent helicase [Pseudothermotoga sp.]|nr:ATP-dependent helicase [Pseudothermotoga sp.]MCX7812927.1 ATP-dependent helicase [Pseudothermotoga sp.]MDW8139834.1 ATP-dependent helicase [Pseudothermotoga sp.]
MKIDYFQELDEEQRVAVLESEGRSLVIAGPGSGKTRVITYKLLHLLSIGVEPSQILLVTFTRAAANEMIERAKRVTGSDLENLTAGTFHHVCNLMLRKYANRLGFSANFTILDEEDSLSLIKHVRTKVIDKIFSEEKQKHFPAPTIIQKIFSYSANTLSSLRETLLELYPKHIEFESVIEEIHKEYALEKRSQNCMDYDDLLTLTVFLLEHDSQVRYREASKYKWILVDEFQDTNILQLKLVDLLSSVHGNAFVVADDAQSIYSFRGARFENVKDFAHSNAKIFKIQTNYRSTEAIVEFINAMIPRSSVPKLLRSVKPNGIKPKVVNTWDKVSEASFVAKEILRLLEFGYDPNQIGVLYRSHSHSFELQLELSKHQIDFRILSGLRFTETAHVKDVLAFLRLVQNPREKISWIRVARLFPGIGVKTASAFADHASSIGSIEFEDIFDSFPNKRPSLLKLEEVLLNVARQDSVSEKIEYLYESFYREYLENSYHDYVERKADVQKLIEIAERYKSLERFLSDLAISEDVTRETGGRKVTLTTVHQAKGLEWDVVFILSVNPGDFPSYYAITDGKLDEEERIFYVAITRAKELLYIMRQESTKPSYFYWMKMSDFIERIPKHLVEWIDVD